MMDSVSLEELVLAVRSVPHAHVVSDAVLQMYDLHRRAGRKFYEAVRSHSQDMVHRF